MLFRGCPEFKKLRDDDISEDDKKKLKGVDKLSQKAFDKEVTKLNEKQKKIHKKKKKEKAPSIKQIREHLRKIIKYHQHKVNEGIPSIYPILGPANSDDSSDGDDSSDDDKRLHTKRELKRY